MIHLRQVEECTSTNDLAWEELERKSPVLVVARRQTKGRGRQGRVWVSTNTGNLYASFLFFPSELYLSWLPLAAGVAAMEALEELFSRTELHGTNFLSNARLKWPNDLYWEDSKLGGILCESRFSGDRCLGAVVGIGLNLIQAPQVPEMSTVALADHLDPKALSPDFARQLAWSWAEHLLAWEAELSIGKTEGLREAWLKWAKLDRHSLLQVHDRSGALVSLTALTLDSTGKLVAERTGGVRVMLDQAGSVD